MALETHYSAVNVAVELREISEHQSADPGHSACAPPRQRLQLLEQHCSPVRGGTAHAPLPATHSASDGTLTAGQCLAIAGFSGSLLFPGKDPPNMGSSVSGIQCV